MNLDFLFYQKKFSLGGEDPKHIENRPYIEAFREVIRNGEINDVIALLIKSYKTEYAQYKFFWGAFFDLDAPEIDFEKPEHLLKTDWCIPEPMIGRDDLQWVVFYMEEDSPAHRNADLIKEMEFQFKTEQTGLVETVHSSLSGLEYTSELVDGTTVFKVKNCPILEIRITDRQFNFATNPDFWKPYFGY